MKTGGTERFPSLDDGQWDEILDLGLKQGVTGLLFSGASSLPDSIIIPYKTAIRLMMETDRIIRRSEKISNASESILAALKTKGLNPTVMKGPSAAALSPEPKLRESGDLDIFLPPSEFEKAIEVVAPGSFRKDPDGNILYHWDGIDIDQHPRYFDLHCSEESKLGKRLLSLIPFDGACCVFEHPAAEKIRTSTVTAANNFLNMTILHLKLKIVFNFIGLIPFVNC